MIAGTILLACLLYGLGSLNVVGDLLPEGVGIALVAVMILLCAAGLICLAVGVRAVRRRSRAS